MPIFLVTFEIRNGESEYISHRVAEADTLDGAEEKARRYISDFWGDATVQDKENKNRFWLEDWSECISLSGIEEVTVEQLIQRLSIK